MSGRAAVIDLGSLAVRLHIAEPRPETARGEGVREGEGDAEAPPGSPPVPFLSLHQARRISRLAENLARGKTSRRTDKTGRSKSWGNSAPPSSGSA